MSITPDMGVIWDWLTSQEGGVWSRLFESSRQVKVWLICGDKLI